MKNTLSTKPYGYLFKYSFFEPFKTTIKNTSVQTHTYISTSTLFFRQEKTTRWGSPYSKLLLKGCELEEMFNITKFRIFDSYPRIYICPISTNFKKNHVQHQIWPYSNSFLNRKELGKHFYTKKLRIFHNFPTPYHLRQSDKPFAKNRKNKFRPEFHRFSNYFWMVYNLKK